MKQIDGSITATADIRATSVHTGIKAVETIVPNPPATLSEESCNASERYGEVGCPLITR